MHRVPIVLLALLLSAAACDDSEPGESPDPGGLPDVASDVPTADIPDATPPEDPGAVPDSGPELPPPPSPFESVNAIIGTGHMGGNFGANYPGATTPFGMVALSPDTEGTTPFTAGVVHAGGYNWLDTEVMGFSHTHLAGIGSADYCNIMVTPQVGDPAALTAKIGDSNLPLDHDLEHAEPGYYRIEFPEQGILAELTATPRAGAHRYTFEPTAEALLLFDVTHVVGDGTAPDSSVTVDPTTGLVEGWLHNDGQFTGRYDGFMLYFSAELSRPPTQVGTFDADGYEAGRLTAGGTRSGAALHFDTTTDAVVEVRVGISFVDLEGARANLAAEAPLSSSFDDLRAAARAVWEDALGVIEVRGGTPERAEIFYSALYHVLLMPDLLTDVDGRYRGLDKEVHTADGFLYYSDFSMWDTYRTFHPLVVLLYPDLARDFMRSLTRMAEDGGSMPVWPLGVGYTGSMVGTSADIVIGDAVDKGITDFDVESAYQAMRALATAPPPPGRPGRDGLLHCLEHGYCPADLVNGSVSLTLEYSADDYCLARLAELQGHADDATLFADRVDFWKAHWEPERGFLAPRNSDGTFLSYAPTSASNHYVEGSPWHYLFMLPHDAADLVTVIGGPEAFVDKLGTFMQEGRDHVEDWGTALPTGYYYHGNEPTIASSWLFGFAGRRDLTASWTHFIADTSYGTGHDGLAGNDDGGTLSAWYVFAAAGFYPLPCTGQYALGAPLFDRVVLHLPAGDLVITAGDDPDGIPQLNGEPHDDFLIAHDAIVGGGTLELPAAKALPL